MGEAGNIEYVIMVSTDAGHWLVTTRYSQVRDEYCIEFLYDYDVTHLDAIEPNSL